MKVDSCYHVVRIYNFSIFHGFPYLKNSQNLRFQRHPYNRQNMRFQRRPSLDFSANSGIFRGSGKIKEKAFEIADFGYFSKEKIHEKSRNFRNRVFATFPLSHFPRVFPPGAPAENLEDREKTREKWESGKVGKWESGKVAKSRFLKFLDFSWIAFLKKC